MTKNRPEFPGYRPRSSPIRVRFRVSYHPDNHAPRPHGVFSVFIFNLRFLYVSVRNYLADHDGIQTAQDGVRMTLCDNK